MPNLRDDKRDRAATLAGQFSEYNVPTIGSDALLVKEALEFFARSAERYTHAFKVPIRWRYNAKGQVQIVDADDRIVPIENVLASINHGATPSAIEPTEAEVEEAAKIIAATPLIDAPRLNWQQWCGLARRILSVRGSERNNDRG